MVHLESADHVDADALQRAVERLLPGIVASTDSGDWYLIYDPDGITVPE